jgi:type II secretory pathway pseudopilin PulG
LIELVVVAAIVAVLASASIPRAARYIDRIKVAGATREIATVFATARMAAIARASFATVRVDEPRGSVTALMGRDTIMTRNVGSSFGVKLKTTRDTMAYNPVGLGYGAANLSVTVSRGNAVDTVVTSRLGRIRF